MSTIVKFDPTLPTTVRDFDIAQTKEQIGRMNILAVSGGRTMALPTGILMAAGQGYYVSVHLRDNDTYTVRRLFKRGGYIAKRIMYEVEAEQLSDAVYYAGMYHHEWGAPA